MKSLKIAATLGMIALAVPVSQAGHRDRDVWRTRSLAYRLDSAARVLFRDAERYARHGAIRDEILLDRLWDLKRATQEFRFEARRTADLKRLRHEFRELLPEFQRASRALWRFNRSGHVARRYQRVERLVAQLEATLGVRYARQRHERPRDRDVASTRRYPRRYLWPDWGFYR